ncbi:hypothetical protein BB560_003385 [Smittium megazygosporum]|uniref:Protein-serine/threonine kinase n=1 Tax=Smittium megazygosporum TaxID=133381 RepID=A0A2T9ZC36_9FUNG|nr:hypothetical protein BB560_003385 [Smittium megazygosporum]
MLMTRISRRTLAEQHIALTRTFMKDLESGKNEENFSFDREHPDVLDNRPLIVGKVHTKCQIAQVIQKCTSQVQSIFEERYSLKHNNSPKVIIDGDTTANLMCLADHIEYIIFEVLKNSMKYTIASVLEKNGGLYRNLEDLKFNPIHVTISQTKTTLSIRISDRGGGISPEVYKQLWNYCSEHKLKYLLNFNKIKQMEAKVADNISLSLGFGLPMSKVYAKYWGGDIKVYSTPEFGVDAYITLPRLGNVVENPAMEDYTL